ncbi:transcription antitermination factor NusB [Demequina aurantiaca]|uniref:transcription antitermination factor NusB n=1 Tax=Demequina aurantiaca TaxID=676200 RepID=UPI003D3582C6
MGARTKARKRALDVLFEADQRGYNATSTLDQRILLSGRETPLPPYAVQIVRGVVSRWVELNSIIQDASPAWTIARMPGIDRGLLRIATWEILCNDEVPTSVAINEAVTLATQLSTDESARFINGLLSTIAKDAPALSSLHMEEVESVDGAAIFDSLGADTVFSDTATNDDSDDDDSEDDVEADHDFPDSGLADDVAKEWAERLLADDAATLIPATDIADASVNDATETETESLPAADVAEESSEPAPVGDLADAIASVKAVEVDPVDTESALDENDPVEAEPVETESLDEPAEITPEAITDRD